MNRDKKSVAIDWNKVIKEAVEKLHVVTTYYAGIPTRRSSGLLFFELYTCTGYSRGNPQRVDALHMCDLPSQSYTRTAYEIKVSRRDFMGEVSRPNKRRAAMLLSNLFYFVTPYGLIQESEVPANCGLLEVHDSGQVTTKVKAPWRETHPPTWAITAAMVRAGMKRGGRP